MAVLKEDQYVATIMSDGVCCKCELTVLLKADAGPVNRLWVFQQVICLIASEKVCQTETKLIAAKNSPTSACPSQFTRSRRPKTLAQPRQIFISDEALV